MSGPIHAHRRLAGGAARRWHGLATALARSRVYAIYNTDMDRRCHSLELPQAPEGEPPRPSCPRAVRVARLVPKDDPIGLAHAAQTARRSTHRVRITLRQDGRRRLDTRTPRAAPRRRARPRARCVSMSSRMPRPGRDLLHRARLLHKLLCGQSAPVRFASERPGRSP